MLGELRAFRKKRLTPEEGRAAAERALSMPIGDRVAQAQDLHLDDPETLLPLFEILRNQWETNPHNVLDEAAFIYEYLETLKPNYPSDAFLLDEREYFLGEAARIAAAVCRQLSLREEVRRWLDLAEGWFLQTENATGNLAKVSYQRLALRIEERDFEAVSKLLPQLVSTFERLGMREDALKTRLLGALVFKETDRLAAAADALNEIVDSARMLKCDAIQAWAYVNLVQVHGYLGDAQAAIAKTKEATPILRRVENRIGLAKLQWGIGALLKSRSDLSGAIEAYRSSQEEFSELGMRADVAAVQLVIADLLLDSGQEKQAEWEIRQALPLIDEYKLVPEGFAAMTLLRESLRRQKIDRQALRNLHGYFEELSS
jgi:tetratricopeptide (TPR) repeat protein